MKVVAEIEKKGDKYIFVFPKTNQNVTIKVLRTYSTKANAVRAFSRFNVALNDRNNFRIIKRGKPIIQFSSRNHAIAKFEGFSDEKNALKFINSVNKKDLFLKDKDRFYYFVEDINKTDLNSPIKVEIEIDEKEYVSKISELNIFAYGENLQEVISELKYNLQELFEDLFNKNYNLSDKAIEYKNFLTKHMY